MSETNNNGILDITKSDQYRTINELFEHSQANASYYMLLVLSVFVVANGLILNNAAIVIGGMLITPMLTPILVVGLSLAAGELSGIKRVLWLAAKSSLVVIAISFVIALLFGQPQEYLIFENNVRTVVLYFIIAVISGVAAAFAWARKEISEVLPGVSIAVSLVPPLSLVGIWLSVWNTDIVRFYLLVFILNFFGIVVGSLVVFSLLKFSKVEKKVAEKAEEVAPPEDNKS